MYPKEVLWNLRTKLPMSFVLEKGEDILNLPFKFSEGYLRFLCPNCNEFLATVNTKNNLAHCFFCKKNFNNIDLLMITGYTFKSSVDTLWDMWDAWLEKERKCQAEGDTKPWQYSNSSVKKG